MMKYSVLLHHDLYSLLGIDGVSEKVIIDCQYHPWGLMRIPALVIDNSQVYNAHNPLAILSFLFLFWILSLSVLSFVSASSQP